MLIPKLLLQPLVENAVIHGIEPIPQPCHLYVLASLDQRNDVSMVKISIQDNGCGFDAHPKAEKNFLGIANVRERLRLAYKETSFSITSQVGQGTQVLIEIPMQPKSTLKDHTPASRSPEKQGRSDVDRIKLPFDVWKP